MPVFVALLVAGVVEISVLVLVGQAIGALPTIGLLAASAVLGAWLLRREGRRTLQEFSEAARLRRPPERELSDGVLIALGGLLILLPGLVGDVVGLLLLLPPSRAVLRRRLQRAAERRSRTLHEKMRAQAQGQQARGQGPSATTSRNRQTDASTDDVIDGEVVSVTEDDETDGKSGWGTHLPPPQSSDPEEPPGGRGPH